MTKQEAISQGEAMSLQQKLANGAGESLQQSDMNTAYIKLNQKEKEGTIEVATHEGSYVVNKLDISVVKVEKGFFVWSEDRRLIKSYATDDARALQDIAREGSMLVYLPNRSKQVIFTYVYSVIAYVKGREIPCLLYLKKSNLGVAKQMNAFIQRTNAIAFTLGSEKKATNGNNYYVFTVERRVEDDLQRLHSILAMQKSKTSLIEGSVGQEVNADDELVDTPF